mmetsp:Transcript_31727/g.80897  ORF Transcript_31727/g.80897 Transcript_31727/m.80897 type:complete len:202 (+) Transcript_31727:460-1065(+)
MTLALLNMPSFSDTTTNCDCGKCCLIMRPMFCVWFRSSAASTSSRMYSGAGLKRHSARMRDSASSERCPPLSSVSESFHTPPNATRTSRPCSKVAPSGGCSLASALGSSVEKMDPKSRFTLSHVSSMASRFFSSSCAMTPSMDSRSFSTVSRFSRSALYSFSAFSSLSMHLLLTLPLRSATRFSSSAYSAFILPTFILRKS